MGISQTEQAEMCVLARPHRFKNGMDIVKTEQFEIWLLAIPKRLNYGNRPDRTNRHKGFWVLASPKQTEIRVFARPNRTKMGIGQTEQFEI